MSYNFILTDNSIYYQTMAVYNRRVHFDKPDLPEKINLGYSVQDSVTGVIVSKLDEIMVGGNAEIKEDRYIVLSSAGNFELAVVTDTAGGISCRAENTGEQDNIPDDIVDTACRLCAVYNDSFSTAEFEQKVISEKKAESLEKLISDARKIRTDERRCAMLFAQTVSGQNEKERRLDYSDFLVSRNRADLAELIKDSRINSIPVFEEAVPDDDIPVGASKSGGYPDLPPEIHYPVLGKYTAYFHNRIENHEESSMQLLAQINLSETAPFNRDGMLPDHGMLYFFWSGVPYDIDDYSRRTGTKFMFYNGNKATYRVYYYDGDLSRLRRVKPQKPYYTAFSDKVIESRKYVFSCGHYEYRADRFKDELGALYDEAVNFTDEGTKILGVPDCSLLSDTLPDHHISLFRFACPSDGTQKLSWLIGRSDLGKMDLSRVYMTDCTAK